MNYSISQLLKELNEELNYSLLSDKLDLSEVVNRQNYNIIVAKLETKIVPPSKYSQQEDVLLAPPNTFNDVPLNKEVRALIKTEDKKSRSIKIVQLPYVVPMIDLRNLVWSRKIPTITTLYPSNHSLGSRLEDEGFTGFVYVIRKSY